MLAWFPAAAQSHGVPVFTNPIFASPVLFIVGGLGPGVAAVVVMRALHGEAGNQRLLAALWRWRVNIVWWVVAVFAPIAIWLGRCRPRRIRDQSVRARRSARGLSVPTLVIHAGDDSLAPYAHATAAAPRIPGVEFVSIESGGHPFLGQEARVRDAIGSFLSSVSPTVARA